MGEAFTNVKFSVLSGLFAAFGEPNSRRDGAHGPGPREMPVTPLINLIAAVTGGQHGDFVYSQEALDRIITQLMEQTSGSNAPGPASQEDIDQLLKKRITEDMLGAEGRADCSICMDEVNIGEEVSELPCKHWFHHQCVAAWLKEHDTCPHCRKGITKVDENASKDSSGAGARSASGDPTSSMPGAFGVTGEGTAQNPYVMASSSSSSPSGSSHAHGGPGGSNADPGEGVSDDNGISDRLRRGWWP